MILRIYSSIKKSSISSINLSSTSIPSLETYNNVKNGKYNLTKLNKRYKNFSLPNAEVVNLNLHDFGIFLELEPDEEEKQQLEANIQVALQAGNIDVEDAIDLRGIKNLKLANQMLKVKRKQKAKQDQANQQANIAAQSEAQAAAAEKTAMSEVQKQQAISGANVEYEKAKSEFEKDRMQLQAQLDQQKMMMQHKNDMELKNVEVKGMSEKEKLIEDRKDKRSKMEATQQSEMISQRKNDSLPINFVPAWKINDVLL